MKILRCCLSSCLLGMVGAAAMAATNSSPSPVTFNKDVLPILQSNCQTCHRPGEVAPMSLVTYKDARPWAGAIKKAVVSRKMPPWFMDAKYTHDFTNEMGLSDAQINTIVAWVDSGAPEGDAKDKPAPRTFNSGWNIRPDIVVKLPKPFMVPATGVLNYQHVLVKTNFPEDMWVVAAEVRPGDLKVVHHEKVWVRPPGSHWMEDAIPGQAYEIKSVRDPHAGSGGVKKMAAAVDDPEMESDILGKYNPGLGAQYFDVEGAAKFVPKGSDLVFELHYTTNGTATSDVSEIALQLTKTPPTNRLYYYTSGPSAGNLVIPAGDGNAEVAAEVTVGLDNVHLVYMQPHMHLRGKDIEVRAIFPNGDVQTLLKEKYDFNWQLGYQLKEPLALPRGTRLVSILHYDNSASNPYNPDPTKEVRHGPQNWDEMGNLFVGVTLDMKDINDKDKVFHKTGLSLLKPVPGVAGPPKALLNFPPTDTTE